MTPTTNNPSAAHQVQAGPLRQVLDNVRVLLVEDTPDQQRLYLQALQRAGAEVFLECNGQAAIDVALAAAPGYFDVIIMDLAMPILDGLAATQELRRRGYRGAIVAFTATYDEDIRQKWHEAGCDSYLVKSETISRLIDTIVGLTFFSGNAS